VKELVCEICHKHFIGTLRKMIRGDDYEFQAICDKCGENAKDLMELS
jgi:RNase P subunit RPR2